MARPWNACASCSYSCRFRRFCCPVPCCSALGGTGRCGRSRCRLGQWCAAAGNSYDSTVCTPNAHSAWNRPSAVRGPGTSRSSSTVFSRLRPTRLDFAPLGFSWDRFRYPYGRWVNRGCQSRTTCPTRCSNWGLRSCNRRAPSDSYPSRTVAGGIRRILGYFCTRYLAHSRHQFCPAVGANSARTGSCARDSATDRRHSARRR